MLGKTQGELERFRGFRLLRIFKYLPLWLLAVLGEIPLVLRHFGLNSTAYGMAGGFVLASLAVLFGLRHLGEAPGRAARRDDCDRAGEGPPVARCVP